MKGIKIICDGITEDMMLGEPCDVEMWWNRHEQAWVIAVVDKHGYQIGSSEYVYRASGKEFALEIKNDMYNRYVIGKEERK